MVRADSLNAISADGVRFTARKAYPNAAADFERGFAALSAVPCDILLTPRADASDLWGRLAKRDQGEGVDALVDRTACRRYVDASVEGSARDSNPSARANRIPDPGFRIPDPGSQLPAPVLTASSRDSTRA
jgi:hypothetical protein